MSTAKKRFLTVTTYMDDEILCFTEMEYHNLTFVNGQSVPLEDAIYDLTEGDEYSDYVWQWAEDKSSAISQHHDKIDEYQMNPNKATY